MGRRDKLRDLDELVPRAPVDKTLSPDDYEQAMACLDCGLAGMCPPEHFPQEPGVWAQPCPSCNGTVWVAEPLLREVK